MQTAANCGSSSLLPLKGGTDQLRGLTKAGRRCGDQWQEASANKGEGTVHGRSPIERR